MINLPSYRYTHKGCRKEIDGTQIEIYTFKSNIVNQQYIVEIIQLEYDIYVIQYFLKSHRLSENRFNLLLPKDKSSNKHVFFLLNTITKISIEIIKHNPNVSFGFMGQQQQKKKIGRKTVKTLIRTIRSKTQNATEFIHCMFYDISLLTYLVT